MCNLKPNQRPIKLNTKN
uniref:Uncharacterized protein n=1 Tax=Anguilla anguilla TaxID=7936 RepID=A0A0E9PAP6_ANGAN